MERAGLGLESPSYVQKRLVLGKQQRMMAEHCQANKLVRQPKREKAYGVGSQPRALRGAVYGKTRSTTQAGSLSGALSDSNDPHMKKREKHATAYYQEVRNRDKSSEVFEVSKNSGISFQDVSKAYDHLFVNEYDLNKGHTRFDPYYEIAESWRRLREGKCIHQHDVTLILHESLEHDLMKNGLTYDVAHAKSEKLYNYAGELTKYKLNGGV